jgi:hypothetical protein
MTWTKELIKPKLKVAEITLISGWSTLVSAPLSGHCRHVVNVIAAPRPSMSGIHGFTFVGVRTSGASGSETTKKILPLTTTTNTVYQWGGDNPDDEVIKLKLGEELVGRTDILSGDVEHESLWWEE